MHSCMHRKLMWIRFIIVTLCGLIFISLITTRRINEMDLKDLNHLHTYNRNTLKFPKGSYDYLTSADRLYQVLNDNPKTLSINRQVLNDNPKTLISNNQVLNDNPKTLSSNHQVKEENLKSFGGFNQVGDQQVFIYSGFIDSRHKTTYVRLFGMQTQGEDKPMTLHLKLPSGKSVNCQIQEKSSIYKEWPSPEIQYLAYVYACILPGNWSHLSGPVLGNVMSEDSRNVLSDIWLLPVGQTNKKRQTLAVCVKGISGSVDPFRLIEWLEFNKILGVQKVVFYDILTLGKAVKVMKYYSHQGFVDIIPFGFVQKMALLTQNDPMRCRLSHNHMVLEQAYLLSINDCYYRYSNQYQYIMILDIDEIIVPAKNESLLDVIKISNMEFPSATSFTFNTAWHLEEYGQVINNNGTSDALTHLHMQQYLYRSEVMNSQPKSIFHSDRSITVNWHGTLTMPSNKGYRGNYFLPWEHYGFVHHYRKRCKHYPSICKGMMQKKVQDNIIPRYKTKIYEKIRSVRNRLRLF